MRAQFTPMSPHDWADVKCGISSFRREQMIYVYRPTVQSPQVDLKFDLVSKVGGFLGMRRSKCFS